LTHDAPGFFFGALCHTDTVVVARVPGRVDVGGLDMYRSALWTYSRVDAAGAGGTHPGVDAAAYGGGVPLARVVRPRAAGEPAVGRAYPRVALLGNPSDGYGGRVLALAVASEGYAEADVTPAAGAAAKADPAGGADAAAGAWGALTIEVNPELEPSASFASPADVTTYVDRSGCHGAYRIVLAAASVFFRLLPAATAAATAAGQAPSGSGGPARLCYRTTIPPRAGLGGSSALALAVLRALCRWSRLPEASLVAAASARLPRPAPAPAPAAAGDAAAAAAPGAPPAGAPAPAAAAAAAAAPPPALPPTAVPALPLAAPLLAVERDVLGLAAGLQDRVAQVAGGALVAMDFGPPTAAAAKAAAAPPPSAAVAAARPPPPVAH